MYNELIFIAIIIAMFIYFNNKIDRNNENFNNTLNQMKEGFANTLDPNIVAAVTNIYQADIESIRNLSSFASSLMSGNQVIIPANVIIQGNLTISGSLNTTGKLNANNDLSVGGSAQINGNLNTNGNAKSGSLTTGDSTMNGTLNVNGSVNANVISSNGPVYTSEWFRVRGGGGIYWQDYEGGWYMSDKIWMKSFNNKGIYTGGRLQADDLIQIKDWSLQQPSAKGALVFTLTTTNQSHALDPNSNGGWISTH